MFTSGSAAPAATMDDTCIAHSLAGTDEFMAAPCQREPNAEGKEAVEWVRGAYGVKQE